ncbi:uncharacterized protein LOC121967824 [Zingiber officinale]|uniref:uncharacterized protein LOC121967824 n=1 Tax=Zingiber officinale TaxID=94328 RepID=UPI001C4B6332|nr:uncharacterized protein LOC121967824 [Zingiber officinale]
MRRSRSKARKPRYVSLRRHLASPPPEPSDMTSAAAVAVGEEIIGRRRQFDLFPRHPEHLDRDPPVDCLLEDRGGAADPTLAGILGGGSSPSSGSPSPPSLDMQSMNWEDEGGGDGDGLARRALRGRERWAYWRASSSEEEVASTGVVACGVDLWRGTAATRSLALKLDYEEILAAWSDRGPLYTDGDGPQVVPDLHHQIYAFFDSADIPVLVEVSQGGVARPWKVPEAACDGNGCEEQVKEESGGGSSGSSTLISREASVRRYKEKRGNRLFAKKIRYEVRKTNAEKRPRIKGRFVKRKDGNVDHS